jgi:hypothetical protein
MSVFTIYIVACSAVILGVSTFILGMFYITFFSKKDSQELTRGRENITYDSDSSDNSQNTPRTSADTNTNDLTSEFEEPLPLYMPPANPNQRGANLQSYELEMIRVQQEEEDDGRIIRPPVYRK